MSFDLSADKGSEKIISLRIKKISKKINIKECRYKLILRNANHIEIEIPTKIRLLITFKINTIRNNMN